MALLTADLEANYRQLAEERGWTLEQMGDSVEAMNPSLAAELRALSTKRDAAPKGRSSQKREKA